MTVQLSTNLFPNKPLESMRPSDITRALGFPFAVSGLAVSLASAETVLFDDFEDGDLATGGAGTVNPGF